MEVQTAAEDPTDENLDRMYTIVGGYLNRADILPSSSQLSRLRALHQDVEQPNPVAELEANLTTGFAASASGEGEFRVAANFEIPVGEAMDELPLLEMGIDDAIQLDATGFVSTGAECVSVIEQSHVENGERIRERILVPTVSQADLDQDAKLWIRILHGEMEIVPLEPFDPDEFASTDEPGEPNRIELLSELWWKPAPITPHHRDVRYFPYNEEHSVIYNTTTDRWELYWYGEKVSEGSLPYVRDSAMLKARHEISNLEEAELRFTRPQPQSDITLEDIDEPG
jgi:hypothetical protein